MKRLMFLVLAILLLIAGTATAEDTTQSEPPNTQVHREDLVVTNPNYSCKRVASRNTHSYASIRCQVSLTLSSSGAVPDFTAKITGSNDKTGVFLRKDVELRTQPDGETPRVRIVKSFTFLYRNKNHPLTSQKLGVHTVVEAKVVDVNDGLPFRIFASGDSISLPVCGYPYWLDHGHIHRWTEKMGKCLATKPGLRAPGGVAKASRIAQCESGWYSNARSDSGTYQGVYQLGSSEFNAFSHQGPYWVDQEFRLNPRWTIFDARANILAALAHAARNGWGAWECQ